MARRSPLSAAALRLWSILPCLLVLRAETGQPREESLYLWIDAHQARVLIGKRPALSPACALALSPSEGGRHAFGMFSNLILKEDHASC